MKHLALASIVLLIAACNAALEPAAPVATPSVPAPAAEPSPTAAPAPTEEAEAKQASAVGVVRTVDAAAQSLVIKHEPVESLGWPEMTMTFQAPDVDLSDIQAGDAVSFEFTSTGMNGTITSISKR